MNIANDQGLGVTLVLAWNIWNDSMSSLLIGTILMAFAFFLARENKGLLIGEAISRQEYKRIVRLIKEIREVNKIMTIRTMHLAPKDVLVTIEVNLINGLDKNHGRRTISWMVENIISMQC